jgi:hypothetical protein
VESLEFDRIRPGLGRCLYQVFCLGERSLMIVADFGDHENFSVGIEISDFHLSK